MALGIQDSQYDKFKTPFFKVSIGNASGSNLTELPPTISKLIEKIEITESIAGCEINTQFVITFIEGSREPFNKAISTQTKSLYNDADVTNATGMLTDLHFSTLSSGGSGFSSVIASQIGKVQSLSNIISSPGAVAAQVSGFLGDSNSPAPENIQILADDTAPEKVLYVLQEKNIVEVSWGYLEDNVIRKIRGYISLVQTNFPESGQPQTIITCLGTDYWLDQVVMLDPIHFRQENVVGIDPNGGILKTFSDNDTKTAINNLFSGSNFKTIISENLLSTTVDKYHTKLITGDKSPNQFLREMKTKNNAICIKYISPKDGREVIAYISRTDFMAKEIIPNRTLFTYKAPGSILKSISVKADFSELSGAALLGVNSEGVTVKGISTNGNKADTTYDGRSIMDPRPTSGNKIPAAVQLFKGVAVGKVEMTPEADDPNSLMEEAQATAACMQRNVFLEFTSQGYAHLTVGMVYFGGIGNRYSGQYEVITVSHIIDVNGYNIRGTARSAMIDGQTGVKPADAATGQDNTGTVDVQLYQSASNFKTLSPSSIGSSLVSGTIGANAMDEYLEDILS